MAGKNVSGGRKALLCDVCQFFVVQLFHFQAVSVTSLNSDLELRKHVEYRRSRATAGRLWRSLLMTKGFSHWASPCRSPPLFPNYTALSHYYQLQPLGILKSFSF